ncbi:MAG: hypothetical protein WCS17_00795 [Prevotella sp.]|jgi:chromosome segregation ATPase|nr:hypothetical protein [Prevotella sp.]
MKKLLLTVVCFTTISFCSLAQEPVKSVDLTSVTIEQNNIKREFNSLRGEVSVLKNKNAKAESRISALESLNKDLSLKLDSLQKEYDNLANNQKADKSELSTIIGETNEKVLATEEILSSRTLWGLCGIIALIVALAAIVWAFLKKFKSGTTSIDDVRKAQSSLEEAQENIRKAQEKMQEETIQLDNKLIEVLSKQSVSAPTTTDDGEIDHSLTLKVADEIVKIEMNLSRMDESIKGYKQLSRGVQRIKDNFKANDYEIVDMLGKPYQAGMKAAVTFVTDDTLEPGQQIISRIIKPQVNYKQVMIQAAQIEVSQAE